MGKKTLTTGTAALLMVCLAASVGLAQEAGRAGEEIFQLEPGFKDIPALIMVTLMAVYVGVGFLSRVSTTSGYWVAGQGIGKYGNGAAIASDWMSAASFMGVAGLLYLQGWFGLGYIIGWTGGYVLLLVLLAAQLRRFGKYTIPEFLGDRFDSHGVRLFAATVTVIIAITYATAQFKGIGLICGWIFGMNYAASVFFAAGVVLAYMLISGMAGVTRNQQIQYVVLISAFLIPLWILMKKAGGAGILPQLEYGRLLSDLMEGRTAVGVLEGEELMKATKAYLPWGTGGTIYHFIALVFTLMVGTAGLPHIMIRFYTVKNEDTARRSVLWGLFFIGLLYWSSPVYAALGKFWNPLGGRAVADVIILSAPERADLGIAFIGYLAAGAMAAGISTVAGLLVAGASAVAHDWYATVFRPHSTDKQQLFVGRVFTAVLCGIVVLIALNPPALIAQIVAMAFAIAGNTIFPACVLAVWYSRANKYGALAGMTFGLAMTLLAMFGWILNVPAFTATGILPATSSALIVCPLAFLIIILVSNLTQDKISDASLERSYQVLRKLHKLPAPQTGTTSSPGELGR
ncbi:VC_2705 family sodium/solute symporter [Geoalkalibacter halelectricus]|uniref:VC_2705 family sodium/solute symporter n=1 Tax=Geoalkalibacter halelectricus TaxID=2847045 RepID=A0ABY5ZSM0_9BACT|nr:VC_2705 family sodium/solute symporter [Geoalkalibacter halelectricus]MDO3379188.1 VC_2705 family sodium/solute symporter [Geoalkalibacter halelectricus]UWZ80947.1 VC_2705 family sodium/solute symporter [Geoalkalibacter halelectricus]